MPCACILMDLTYPDLGWRLAIIMLAVTPLLLAAGSAMGFFITKYTKKSQDSYALAGAVAEQVFNSIRTVYAFSLQKRRSHPKYCYFRLRLLTGHSKRRDFHTFVTFTSQKQVKVTKMISESGP